jgi:hypothetical protein
MDAPALQAEVTRAREAATDVEATRVMATLAAETSAREATAAWDGIALRIKDVEDWATLAKREALERVSRAEAENATVLASTREDVDGFAWKVALHEDEPAAEHRA